MRRVSMRCARGASGLSFFSGLHDAADSFKRRAPDSRTLSDSLFERRGTTPRPRRMPCEFCGSALADPIEEPYNLAFIAHLRASPRCMELFGYGMTALRNELGVRLGKKPAVDGL